MSLSSYRAPDSATDPSHSPTGSRHSDPSPRPGVHRNSVSSTRSHVSPPMSSATLKRPLSPGPEESDNKRSRMEGVKRRVSSPAGVPRPSSRPSPIPFRTQPASHSPEARQPLDPYPPPSPPLPAVLPPHPRPVGAGLSHVSTSGPIALPPIATLSPPSTTHSPTDRDRDDRMQVDGHRSTSPPSRSKGSEGASSRSPPVKHTPSPSSDKKDSGP
jgi:hypothetical protein